MDSTYGMMTVQRLLPHLVAKQVRNLSQDNQWEGILKPIEVAALKP